MKEVVTKSGFTEDAQSRNDPPKNAAANRSEMLPSLMPSPNFNARLLFPPYRPISSKTILVVHRQLIKDAPSLMLSRNSVPNTDPLDGHGGELSRNGAIPRAHHVQRARLSAPPKPRRRRLHQRIGTAQDIRLRPSTRHLSHRTGMRGDPRVA